jgi:hypothetical protein
MRCIILWIMSLVDVKFCIECVKFYTFPACPFHGVLSVNNTIVKGEFGAILSEG